MDYSTITVMASFVGMLIGMWNIARAFRKDIDRVFVRFDDHKEDVDKKLFLLQDITSHNFVRRDNCTLQTEVFKGMFNDIKSSIISVDRKIDNIILKGSVEKSS